jgi:hypothetical protein
MNSWSALLAWACNGEHPSGRGPTPQRSRHVLTVSFIERVFSLGRRVGSLLLAIVFSSCQALPAALSLLLQQTRVLIQKQSKDEVAIFIRWRGFGAQNNLTAQWPRPSTGDPCAVMLCGICETLPYSRFFWHKFTSC